MTMAQALGIMPFSMVLKLMEAPTRPNSTGIMMKRQNQRTCFSTARPICGPLSPARTCPPPFATCQQTTLRDNQTSSIGYMHAMLLLSANKEPNNSLQPCGGTRKLQVS